MVPPLLFAVTVLSTVRSGDMVSLTVTNEQCTVVAASVDLPPGDWEMDEVEDGYGAWLDSPRKMTVFFGGEGFARVRLVPLQRSDETSLWQGRIDAASAAGGGTVVVTPGCHRVGALYLKDNVTLELAEGATLKGIGTMSAYPDVRIPDWQEPVSWPALVSAFGRTNIAIVGKGSLDGNGGKFPKKWRPRGLLFHRCRDIRLEDFIFRDPAAWTCYLRACDGVTVRGVRLDSHGNYNNDGFDIDSRNVLIENCDIDAGDDAICFKSQVKGFACENVEVRNCTLRSCCSAIKFGSETYGAFRNIRVHGIRIERSRRGWMDPRICADVFRHGAPYSYPGMTGDLVNTGAIEIMSVNGASVENVTIRDIDIAETAVPIFIRLCADRRPKFRAPFLEVFGGHSSIRNVLIENVRAVATSHVASSITGNSHLRPDGITLRNVEIVCKGAGASAEERTRPVPERDDGVIGPGGFLQYLPAYGIYLRHADNVMFDNVRLTYSGGFEARDPVVAVDCANFSERNCTYESPRTPGSNDAYLRLGVVTDLKDLERSYRLFKARGVDAVVISGVVGPTTSDDACRQLRETRDRVFDDVNRPEVLYVYNGLMPMRKQAILDANGNESLREYKGTGFLFFSKNVSGERRTEVRAKAEAFEFFGKKVCVFDGDSEYERVGLPRLVTVRGVGRARLEELEYIKPTRAIKIEQQQKEKE